MPDVNPSSGRGSERDARDRGSAVAEFVMVVVMLMLLFLALIGVGLWAYAHNLLNSATAQAARFAASVNLDANAASERAAAILADTILGGAAGSVRCDIPPDAPGPGASPGMVVVHCRMDAPAILPLIGDLFPDLDVTAHVLRELP